jgi:hypothetical protein
MHPDARGKSCGICFEELKKHEENYPAHDLELAAVVHTLKYLEALPDGKQV